MNFFRFKKTSSSKERSHPFHPNTVLRDWGDGQGFTIGDATCGCFVSGGTGSGKTSGPGRHVACGLLAHGLGGIWLCAKPGEREQAQRWAADCGRSDDVVVVDSGGAYRINFLEWEAKRATSSGHFTITVVSLLCEISQAISRAAGKSEHGGGDNKFWEDSLEHALTNLVQLVVLAGLEVSLPLLRSIMTSAPLSIAQMDDPAWQQSPCAAILREADEATAKQSPGVRADFEECRTFWTHDFPNLSEKTRSIIVLSFSILVRPLTTGWARTLFCSDTNLTPEDTFTGKIIIIDLPIQEQRLAGRIAAIVWKRCFQIAVLRRRPPANGYLQPAFLWADECQCFISASDAEYQSVARSAGGITVYLTQSREMLRNVVGNNDAVDALLANLQTKFFCQGTGETNEWAAKLIFGERWSDVTSTNIGRSGADTPQHSSGVTSSEQRRYFVEPSRFATLKRGGAAYGYQVESIVYKGGHLFRHNGEMLPYRLLTFNQRD